MPGNRLGAQERALQVDRQHPVEIVFLKIQEIRSDDDAGIVDQNIDITERIQRFSHQIAHVQAFGHIAMQVHHIAEA